MVNWVGVGELDFHLGGLFLSDVCSIKGSCQSSACFPGFRRISVEWTSWNVYPAHCRSWNSLFACRDHYWWKSKQRNHQRLWNSFTLSLFRSHDSSVKEKDADAPGGVTFNPAFPLKMPSSQGISPVTIKRGSVHWECTHCLQPYQKYKWSNPTQI